MAGRGFGKTRSGSEWVLEQVSAGCRRIALVGATAADVRDVMIEGESGILACSPDWNRPTYEPSKRRLTWPNGAIATTFSAEEPIDCADRSTTPPGAMSSRAGDTPRLGICSCSACGWESNPVASSRLRRGR
jgi:Terminase large subunit, T4likevirus-type, N-terminal